MTEYPKNRAIKHLSRIEKFARLLDEQFRFPGTTFRFGLDPLLNLIPIAGDIAGLILSSALLFVMIRHGVSRKVVILMTVNIVLDFVIGGIPLLGQIFDFFFKANKMNLKILKEHYAEGRHQGSGGDILLVIFLILSAIVILVIYLLWKLSGWILSFF